MHVSRKANKHLFIKTTPISTELVFFLLLLIRNMPLLGGKKGGSDKTVEMESGAALGYDFWRLSGVRTVL